MREVLTGGWQVLTENPNAPHDGVITYYDDHISISEGSKHLVDTYYKVTPGRIFYYDFIFSNTAGAQFYIGFERYDAVKTVTYNGNCNQYVVNTKAACTKQRVSGTVEFTVDYNGNPVDTIRVRALVNWIDYTTVIGTTEIYRWQIFEFEPGEDPKNTILYSKKGIVAGDVFEYGSEVQPRDYGIHDCNSIIEY